MDSATAFFQAWIGKCICEKSSIYSEIDIIVDADIPSIF